MSGLETLLARRGVELAHSTLTANNNEDGEEIDIKISPAAMLLVLITFITFVALMAAIRYTYGLVVGTLTIVESPETDTYVPVSTLADDGTNKSPDTPPLEPDVLHLKTKPITSSLRSTVLHLRTRAGYWSRFRGLSLFLCWAAARSFLAGILARIFFMESIVGYGMAAIISEVILARWELTWYHIVISEPSQKKWYQHLPAFRSSWPKIAPAVALRAVSQRVAIGMPMMLCSSFGAMRKFQDPTLEPGKKELYTVFGQSLMGLFLTFALLILLEIPAMVTVVRVAASMLPEEDETIVPFDRTFGGKVTPAIIGGAGKIGMLEAWRSFAWSSRIRLLKLMGKVFAIVVAVWLLFLMVLAVEAHFILGGDQLSKLMKGISGVLNEH